jgi:WS/DGAT/MGAT family acyltransferase
MMSSSDAIIWDIEADPQLRSTVMSVWLLDSVPATDRMTANIHRMMAAIPRLRQVVAPGRPRPSWVEVHDVAIEDHFVIDELPAGSDCSDVLAFAERWVAEPFDRSRPLWRLGLLTGLPDGRAAMVIKVHHAIADGLGMVMMLGAFTDVERDPPAEPARDNVVPLTVPRPAYSPLGRVARKLGNRAAVFTRRPIETTRSAGRTLASAAKLVMPNRTPHSRLMTRRSGQLTMDVRSVPLRRLKEIGRRNGATLNDVFVAIVGDAIRRYHEGNAVACNRLRVHMPVNSRTARTADFAGNDFVPARFSMQLDGDDDLDRRVARVSERVGRLRDEPALRHITTVSALVQRLGRPISRWVIGGMMKGVDALASNVPGPPFPLFIAGARIEEFVAFGPPAGAAVNMTLFSYDGDVRMGITTDEAAVTDRAGFLACLDAAIDELAVTPFAAAAV